MNYIPSSIHENDSAPKIEEAKAVVIGQIVTILQSAKHE